MKNLHYFLFLLFVLPLRAQTPQLRIQLGHSDEINSIVYSPDGKYLYSASDDKTIKVWDVKSGKEIRTISGHTDKVKSLAISADGEILASGGSLKEKRLIFWNTLTGEKISQIRTQQGESKKAITGIQGNVVDISFHSFKPWVLVTEADNQFMTYVNVWDYKTQKLIYSLKKNKSFFVKSAKFNPNGRSIAIAGKWLTKPKTKNIIIYNVEDGKQNKTLESTATDISELQFSKDGYRLLSVGTQVQVWDASTFELKYDIKENATCGDIDADGFHLAFGSGKNLSLYSIKDRKKIYTIPTNQRRIKNVVISPKAHYIMSSSKSGELKLWDINGGKYIPLFKSNKADIVKDIAVKDERTVYTVVDKKNVQYWNFRKLKLNRLSQTASSKKRGFQYTGIEINPKNSQMAALTTNKDKGTILWDLKRDKELNLLKNTSFIKKASFNTSGDWVYGGGNDNKIVVWEAGNPDYIKKLNGHYGNINSFDFTKDGKFFLSSSNDKTFKVWNMESDKALYSFKTKHYINKVLLSPDQRTIVTASGNKKTTFGKKSSELALWNWDYLNAYNKKDSIPIYLTGHTKAVTDALFSPDGKVLFTAGADNKIIVWDMENKTKKQEFLGHESSVNTLALDTKNNILYSGGEDALINMWDLNKDEKKLSIVSFNNGKDYVMFTPDNYYTCTKEGVKNVHFTIDNEVYLFEQFDLKLNRPDLVAANLPGVNKHLVSAYYRAYLKRLKKMGFTLDMLGDDFHIPHVNIMNADAIPYLSKEKTIELIVDAWDEAYPLDRINVWVNNVPIFGSKGVSLREDNSLQAHKEVQIELSKGYNKIQISVLNQKGAESFKADKYVFYEADENQKSDLYVVAIGVSQYKDSQFNLDYAAKDAGDIVKLFEKQTDKYAQVHTKLITNEEATVENIRQAKAFLMNSKVDDQVIVFMACHGLLDEDLNYYLATNDIDFYQPQKRGLMYDNLEGIIDGIPARKKILLIDACHSGEVDEDELNLDADGASPVGVPQTNSGIKSRGFKSLGTASLGLSSTFELMKELFADLRRGSGAMVISSAGGKEFALESNQWQNGVFTYSLLEGLETGNADLDKNGTISISEMRDYISKNVEKLTNGQQHPTSRRENLEYDYKIW